MKKTIILFQILIAFIAYAGPQRDSLNYYYVQLKIVNLSDNEIDFYYNDLNHRNTHLVKGQEEITYKTPITDDYPGFIAIGRINSKLEIYKTRYINEIKCEFYYLVLIYNDTVKFYILYDINDDYKRVPEHQNRTSYWEKLELSAYKNIIIKLCNLSGETISISSNGYLFAKDTTTSIIGNGIDEYGNINLENDSKCIYTINSGLFSLKYIYFNLIYPKIYTNKEQTTWDRLRETINVYNHKEKNITIIINGYNNGYEIVYE
jgi:hypothetical protein